MSDSKKVARELSKPFPLGDKVRAEVKIIGLVGPHQVSSTMKKLDFRDEKIAIVVADVIRCSTTMLAALAMGAKAVTAVDKLTGLDHADAEGIGKALGLDTVYGGELFGKAVPGGMLRNSPLDPGLKQISGKHVYFLTSNLGSLLYKIIDSIPTKVISRTTIILGAYQNMDSVAKYLASHNFDRTIFCAAGLKDGVAVEDIHFMGHLINKTAKEDIYMNAEAHLMTATATSIRDIATTTKLTPTGRILEGLGNVADIEACLTPGKLTKGLEDKMSKLVPTATIINKKAVFKCI